MEETSLLSEAETARYRDQGYLALKDMCPQDEVGYIRRTLLDLFANKTGYNEGAQYDFAWVHTGLAEGAPKKLFHGQHAVLVVQK